MSVVRASSKMFGTMPLRRKAAPAIGSDGRSILQTQHPPFMGKHHSDNISRSSNPFLYLRF